MTHTILLSYWSPSREESIDTQIVKIGPAVQELLPLKGLNFELTTVHKLFIYDKKFFDENVELTELYQMTQKFFNFSLTEAMFSAYMCLTIACLFFPITPSFVLIGQTKLYKEIWLPSCHSLS